MIIRTNDKEININSIIGDSIRKGSRVYPALRFEFPTEVTASDIEALLSGTFDIVDDNGNVLGTHDGYNTLKSISVVIGKITSAEEEVIALEAELAAAKTELADAHAALDIIVEGEVE